MINQDKIQRAMKEILEAIGEDPNREGLLDTPKRIAQMYAEIFGGLDEDPSKYLETTFVCEYKDMVLVKDISFYSMCEHHFLPFIGRAHIAYIPQNGIVTGLSKLARVVGSFARRPQIQERLTSQIAEALVTAINPAGVMVIAEAEHLCMSMRGVKNPGTKTVTTAARGIFTDDVQKRNEVFAMIQ